MLRPSRYEVDLGNSSPSSDLVVTQRYSLFHFLKNRQQATHICPCVSPGGSATGAWGIIKIASCIKLLVTDHDPCNRKNSRCIRFGVARDSNLSRHSIGTKANRPNKGYSVLICMVVIFTY